ncbi:unnamed protein product [Bemisia tabaci]|uniref:Uncharacterized protein n=1 Tax=Bemisia tabaci TaxID=7038 RepID=A0A9P0A2Z7_BEMTA|nr:unnamed protein product [Bemisia tabaci]
MTNRAQSGRARGDCWRTIGENRLGRESEEVDKYRAMNGRTILFLLTQVLHCSLAVDHTTHSPQPGSTQGGKPLSTASTQVPLLVSKLTSHATVNVKAATIAATKEATVEATTPTKGTRAPTTAELPSAAPKTGTVLGVSVPPEAPPEPPVSPLDEKIQALNCEMPALPTGSVVWTQNSTRTLVFPLRVSRLSSLSMK